VTDNEPSFQPDLPGLPPVDGATASAASSAFFGPNGLRAGWRLLIAAAIFLSASRAFGLALRHARGGSAGRIFSSFAPQAVLFGEFTTFGIYLFTSWIMSRIEARRMRDYGLGLASAFGGAFWLSAAIGFAAISLLLGVLKIAGVFQLGEPALHGAAVWRYGALWAIAFLFVGFQEEGTSRGYLLFTLTTGVGFWPAAIATSLMFGAVHLGNTGESYVGALSAGGIGFFFCILVRKTGNLWAAIGFHAAWDWGETFFFGVPDSGLVAPGHLFSARFLGPIWLTGGSVGPEASWFCLILIALLCIAAAFLPGVKYPNPEAIPDPRRRRIDTAQSIFPQAAKEF
jgi:hypothetical protein